MALARVRSFSSFPGSSKESPNTKIAFNEGLLEITVAPTVVRGVPTWEQMQLGPESKQIRAKEERRRRSKVAMASLAAGNWP